MLSCVQATWDSLCRSRVSHVILKQIQVLNRDWAEQSCFVSVARDFPFSSCRVQMETVRIHIQMLHEHIKTCISHTFLFFVVDPESSRSPAWVWFLIDSGNLGEIKPPWLGFNNTIDGAGSPSYRCHVYPGAMGILTWWQAVKWVKESTSRSN